MNLLTPSGNGHQSRTHFPVSNSVVNICSTLPFYNVIWKHNMRQFCGELWWNCCTEWKFSIAETIKFCHSILVQYYSYSAMGHYLMHADRVWIQECACVACVQAKGQSPLFFIQFILCHLLFSPWWLAYANSVGSKTCQYMYTLSASTVATSTCTQCTWICTYYCGTASTCSSHASRHVHLLVLAYTHA